MDNKIKVGDVVAFVGVVTGIDPLGGVYPITVKSANSEMDYFSEGDLQLLYRQEKTEEPVPVKCEVRKPKLAVGDHVIHKNMIEWGVGIVRQTGSSGYHQSNLDYWEKGDNPFSKDAHSPFYFVVYPKFTGGWWSSEDLLVHVEIMK